MKGQPVISKATIDRLPLYFRTLRLAQDEGIDIISSDELGRRLSITPEQIRSHDDLISIPHIFVTAFKQHRLLSLPEDEIHMTFTSSGTQGQKSQINLDRISFERQANMRALLVRSLGLMDPQPVNYLVFSYAPQIADNRGAGRIPRRKAVDLGEAFVHALQPGAGVLQGRLGEIQRIAVLGGKDEQPQHLGLILLEHVADGEEITKRFRHLFVFDGDESMVHPQIGKRFARGPAALGNLVFVVGKHQILAAAVDVKGFT